MSLSVSIDALNFYLELPGAEEGVIAMLSFPLALTGGGNGGGGGVFMVQTAVVQAHPLPPSSEPCTGPSRIYWLSSLLLYSHFCVLSC